MRLDPVNDLGGESLGHAVRFLHEFVVAALPGGRSSTSRLSQLRRESQAHLVERDLFVSRRALLVELLGGVAAGDLWERSQLGGRVPAAGRANLICGAVDDEQR